MRVRLWRPFVLVFVTLLLAAASSGAASAATGPREQAALVELFATHAALVRARDGAEAAHARLARLRNELRSVRERLGVARSNQRASQRALALRLNEIYRADPLDTLGVLLASRSFADMSQGLDLLDRLSRADGSLVRSARRWRTALEGQSRTLHTAEGRAQAEQAVWEARVADLRRADDAQRSLVRRLRSEHVRSLKELTAAAQRDVVRARTVVRPQPHGGGSESTPVQPAPPVPSLAAGATFSVASTAYSLPGHTASGLPVGQGICATDPRVIPLGTRFDVPGYGPCVAADTGSSVVGATIDIWMPGAQANVYGRQTITITFR